MAMPDNQKGSEKNPASAEEKRLIETLYQNSIDHIAQLKTRQWDVTKWVLAANVGLFVPIAISDEPLQTGVQCAIATLSLFLLMLCVATIGKTQRSLHKLRLGQDKWRKKHPELKAADEFGRPEDAERRDSIWYDWPVWLPMPFVAGLSSLATMIAIFTTRAITTPCGISG